MKRKTESSRTQKLKKSKTEKQGTSENLDSLFVIDVKGEKENLQRDSHPQGQKLNSEFKKNFELTLEELEEEKRLEKTLFGDKDFVNQFGNEENEDQDNLIFQPVQEENENEETEEQDQLKPVWEDEEDSKVKIDLTEKNMTKKLRKNFQETTISGDEYSKRLREQFEKLHKTSTDWAKIPVDGEEAEEDILKTTKKLIGDRVSKRLPPNFLSILRVKDANICERSEAVIQSVRFHPNSQLLLTAGFDKKLRLFQIDGKNNPKAQSVMFPDLPIHTAEFTPDGTEVILTGRRKFFYVYNLVQSRVDKVNYVIGREEKSLEKAFVSPDNKYIAILGNDGYIILLSMKTKQWTANLKMNGAVRSITFSADGNYLFSAGSEGYCYQWDLRTKKCVSKFLDEGNLYCTSLAVSPNSSYIVTGSESGIVNVYDRETINSPKPKLLKEITNLTTKIHHMKFTHDSQILALCSRSIKDCLRLVHFPSMTIFSNWPTSRTPLGYVSSFDFSPNSGYLSIGNQTGKVLLYRLNHYNQA